MRTSTFQDIADCTEFRRLTHAPVPKFLHGTLCILCLLIAAAITWLAMTETNLVVIAEGRVRPVAGADENWEVLTTQLASETGGVVEQVFVDVGEAVRAGDIVLQFNTAKLENRASQLRQKLESTTSELNQLVEYQALLEKKSQQDLNRAQARLEQSKAELEQKTRLRESEIRAAESKLANARDRLQRYGELRKAKAVSQREYVAAETQFAEAQELLIQASLPVSDKQTQVLETELAAVARKAEAEQKEIEIQIDKTRSELESIHIELRELARQTERSSVLATSSGVVTDVNVKTGDVLQPGRIGISTVQQEALALVVNLTSRDIGQVAEGMPVHVKLDAFDFRDFGVVEGIVKFISPDSQLIAGNEGQHVAAYEVTIELAGNRVCRGEHVGHIKLGMSGTSEIVTQRQSLLKLLLRKIRQTISLT